MSCSMPCVSLSTLRAARRVGDLPHVVAHLFDGFGEGDRRALFVQQREGFVDFVDDLRFLATEAGGFDFVIVRALGLGNLVEPHGAVVDGGLHFEHFAEAGGELRERAFELFFAKLAEDALELGLGLLEFFDRLLLVLGRAFALGFLELLVGFLHLLLRFFQAIWSRDRRALAVAEAYRFGRRSVSRSRACRESVEMATAASRSVCQAFRIGRRTAGCRLVRLGSRSVAAR